MNVHSGRFCSRSVSAADDMGSSAVNPRALRMQVLVGVGRESETASMLGSPQDSVAQGVVSRETGESDRLPELQLERLYSGSRLVGVFGGG